ncbi:hypothetical protein T484DRAFT_1760332 [Baffinella frigidus]|nr:hypothetical protein T484DRAFT_1760332 [Cryptophyta sp. CCMP2293]
MSGPTWSFTGEKRLDNFFDHFFIRNNLVPGHSAGQGGNAPSSHTRDVATDLYLRRSTLHTVAEGGQQGQAGLQQGKGMELHAARAALSIAEVDLLRRKEFIRRRDAGEIDQRVKGEEYIDKIRRQVGWPFSIGQQPTMAEMMEKEDGDPLYPQRRMKDWDRKWDREPLAVVKVATEEQQQDPNFVALAGPLGYEKGYLEVKEAEGEPNTESFKAAGWYWSGPEKRPALLDVMVWKPLSKAGPAIISALDAKKTEENLRLGRTLAEPDALAVKRTMKHEYQV